jgi:hypothetical protein
MVSEHIGDIDIVRFHAGKLDRARVEAIGAHVRECPSCAARVSSSPMTGEAAAAIVRGAAEAAPLQWARWVAAAALLVLLAGLAIYAVRRPAARPGPIPIVENPPPQRPAHPWDALVAGALQRGELDRPASLADLRRGGHGVLRGPDGDRSAARLLAPVGVVVASQTPAFRWTSQRGVYEVTVARDGNVVAQSGPMTATAWTPQRPLARDGQYEWQLTVEANGKRSRVPSPEEGSARFRVMSADEARLLAAAGASGDHLIAGIVAAHLGAVDAALDELSASNDPRAAALAKKIRRW